jgi:hypothetical protein
VVALEASKRSRDPVEPLAGEAPRKHRKHSFNAGRPRKKSRSGTTHQQPHAFRDTPLCLFTSESKMVCRPPYDKSCTSTDSGQSNPTQIFAEDVTEEKGENARLSAFVGAIAVGDLVKSTLGPKGMDKILQSAYVSPAPPCVGCCNSHTRL